MTDPNETANVVAGLMPGATGDCEDVRWDGPRNRTRCTDRPHADQCNATGRVLAADETANLVGQLAQGYREHLAEEAGPEIIAVPGRVLGGDIEGQADAMADAARLAELLTAFGQEPRRSLDAIAVFRGLSRTAESMAAAAAELRRQEWFDLEDDAEPEARRMERRPGRPPVRCRHLQVDR